MIFDGERVEGGQSARCQKRKKPKREVLMDFPFWLCNKK